MNRREVEGQLCRLLQANWFAEAVRLLLDYVDGVPSEGPDAPAAVEMADGAVPVLPYRDRLPQSLAQVWSASAGRGAAERWVDPACLPSLTELVPIAPRYLVDLGPLGIFEARRTEEDELASAIRRHIRPIDGGAGPRYGVKEIDGQKMLCIFLPRDEQLVVKPLAELHSSSTTP